MFSLFQGSLLLPSQFACGGEITHEVTDISPPITLPDQFLVGLTRSQPIDKSAERFSMGEFSSQIEFAIFLDESWLIGFGGGFQAFAEPDKGKDIPIARFFQRTRKFFRLYHPVYFATGFELSYIYPSKNQDLVPELSKEFGVEVGVGIVNSLALRLGRTSMLVLQGNVWRGTGSRKFMAYEFGLSYAHAL